MSCALAWSLLLLALIDFHTLRLPDGLTLGLAAAGLAVTYLDTPQAVAAHAAAGAAGFAVFAGIGWAYQRIRQRPGLGLGDAKLLAAAGTWLGGAALPSVVLIACLSGLILCAATGRLRDGVSSDRPFAFGPHLCLAIWLVWLYGPWVPLAAGVG